MRDNTGVKRYMVINYMGVGPLTRGLVWYNIAPIFATFTLSFDSCLAKLRASLYRHCLCMCCIFMLKILPLTCYIIMALYVVNKIIKWPLSTRTLCVFCSKLAQGSASMYDIIHIEHQQEINIIIYKVACLLFPFRSLLRWVLRVKMWNDRSRACEAIICTQAARGTASRDKRSAMASRDKRSAQWRHVTNGRGGVVCGSSAC